MPSSFMEPLIVEALPDGKTWKLTRDLRYERGFLGSGDIITVPSGTITDFASVPRIFWTICPPFGKYTAAAVVHDFLYSKRGEYSRSEPALTRKESDAVFLEAMTVLGVPLWKRFIMWRAVRRFGWISYPKK